MPLSFLTCTHALLLLPARVLTQELLHFLRASECTIRVGVLHLLPLLLPAVQLTQRTTPTRRTIGCLNALSRLLMCMPRTTPTLVDPGMVGT